ncbi:MAG: hypothetical protein LBJ08_03225 [Bifidobacteriaceae bacterium]|nr:hypothetical protein [Bifidobacteriaceae bacterium]
MKPTRIVLLIAMALLIAAPTIVTALGGARLYPGQVIDENRYRAEAPAFDVDAMMARDGAWSGEWTAYYDDRFGPRDLFIRAKNQIDYSAFHYSSGLFFDHEDNMYYRSVVAQQQPLNESMSDEAVDQQVELYRRIEAACRKKGVSLSIIIAPQKNTVYQTEGLPVLRPTPNRYERMTQRLQEEVPDSFVDVLPALREANEVEHVFFRSDFHWNDYGAAVAFREVTRAIAAKEGVSVTEPELRFVDLPGYQGDQMSNLSVFFPPVDNAITVEGDAPMNYVLEPIEEPYRGHWRNEGVAPLEGTAVFVGDSFTPPALFDFHGTSSKLQNLFSETYYVHWNDAEGMLDRLPEGTRYVIIESTESGIYHRDEALVRLVPEE